MTAMKPPPLLLGIIVDISASMQGSWNNKNHRDRPRFDVVREALDNEIQRIRDITTLHPESDQEINVFCLGLGFRVPLQVINQDILGVYDPLSEDQKHPEHAEMVCDILALSDIAPTTNEIDSIESRLNTLWRSHSKAILDEAVIPDDVYDSLQKYIRETLFEQGNISLAKSWLGRHYQQIISQEPLKKNWWQRKIEQRFQKKKTQIDVISYEGCHRYFNILMDSAQAVFRQHQTQYIEYIQKELQHFIASQTEETLNYVSLGIDITDALDHFDQAKSKLLATTVYHHLETHIREKIWLQWIKQVLRLRWIRLKLNATIDLTKVKDLTEQCIHKRIWELLEPFVRSIVRDLFEKEFRIQSRLMIPTWIELSSAREVIKPLNKINRLFPDIYEDDLYSSSYIFGCTPMKQALERAALRFLNPIYESWTKAMIVVTDGIFLPEHPQRITSHLKIKGVKIIGCYIHNQDVTSKLVKISRKEWPDGASILFDISSEINQDDEFEQRFQHIVTPSSLGHRLFFQINHSEVFQKIINLVLDFNVKYE